MTQIRVETTVSVPREKAWELFTEPEHVTKWNHASDDWHSPRGENELRVGGNFNFRMEAKDGSTGFDFAGAYTEVEPHERYAYEMSDGRKVEVMFEDLGGSTKVTEIFDAETENSVEMQKEGWQAILDNYKRYAESVSYS